MLNKKNHNDMNETRTIEAQIISAITTNKSTDHLIAKVEQLYKEGKLRAEEYNMLTDIDLMKEIYS